MASDSDMPDSTSLRSEAMIFLKRGFCVCSSSTYSARSTARPDWIMVANCLAKTALSRTLILVEFSIKALRLKRAALLIKPQDGQALALQIGGYGLLGVTGDFAGEHPSAVLASRIYECRHVYSPCCLLRRPAFCTCYT